MRSLRLNEGRTVNRLCYILVAAGLSSTENEVWPPDELRYSDDLDVRIYDCRCICVPQAHDHRLSIGRFNIRNLNVASGWTTDPPIVVKLADVNVAILAMPIENYVFNSYAIDRSLQRDPVMERRKVTVLDDVIGSAYDIDTIFFAAENRAVVDCDILAVGKLQDIGII